MPLFSVSSTIHIFNSFAFYILIPFGPLLMHLMPLRRKPLWKMSLGMENKPLPGHHALSNFLFLIASRYICRFSDFNSRFFLPAFTQLESFFLLFRDTGLNQARYFLFCVSFFFFFWAQNRDHLSMLSSQLNLALGFDLFRSRFVFGFNCVSCRFCLKHFLKISHKDILDVRSLRLINFRQYAEKKAISET